LNNTNTTTPIHNSAVIVFPVSMAMTTGGDNLATSPSETIARVP